MNGIGSGRQWEHIPTWRGLGRIVLRGPRAVHARVDTLCDREDASLQFSRRAWCRVPRGRVLDLRTQSPWDQEAVYARVEKTGRVIVAYVDSLSWRYGAEIAARIADECFAWPDASVKRVASTETFVGYAPQLEDATLPQVATGRIASLAPAGYFAGFEGIESVQGAFQPVIDCLAAEPGR